MRKISADYILFPDGILKQNSTLVMQGDVVVDLVAEVLHDAEKIPGILSPGFINAHCHLELSHLQNKIPSGKQLHVFIHDFIKTRSRINDNVIEFITNSDTQMWNNGIQAVGDICNESISFEVKAKSKIKYHNFIELFGRNNLSVEDIMTQGKTLQNISHKLNLRSSLVPHAPYTVTPELFTAIKNSYGDQKRFWSIHNQETASENEMFLNGTGAMAEELRIIGFDRSWFVPTNKNSLPSISKFFPDNSNLLFVHNTFTQKEDIEFLRSHNLLSHSWLAICAKANLYIENKLPDIPMFIQQDCNLVIGTDSLASNDSLSILEELKTIHQHFPQIKISTLLHSATKSGATFFDWQNFGSFEKGLSPGVIQITESNDKAIGENANAIRLI